MSIYAAYPPDYRTQEVQAVSAATRAGECVAIVGLSGSGKSNLMGFLGYHLGQPAPAATVSYRLVDCNRLTQPTTEALFTLLASALEPQQPSSQTSAWGRLDQAIERSLQSTPGLCFLLDRFDALHGSGSTSAELDVLYSSLRALRDAHKYALTYVVAARRPLDTHNELAELFFAHTLWLGPLSAADALWSARQYADRQGFTWDAPVLEQIIALARGYPSFLRAICEAYASGAALDISALQAHPTVQRRVQEFLADQPSAEMLQLSGLADHPLLPQQALTEPVLSGEQMGETFDTSQLTAKEHLLWEYLRQHPNQVCEKDALVQAVWPEDRIFERGIRDDSLAQLVRRLREKIEPDPSSPRQILTVPGRGYRYRA